MDVRVLRYFLVVAREESFSRAAQALYLSQPTLSRQIQELEEELGTQLLIRTNRNVRLTQDGMRLRRRAQEIVELMDRTQAEFAMGETDLTGNVAIGSGETQLFRPVAQVASDLHARYPGITFQLYSGNADDVAERLNQGLLDFGVMLDPGDIQRYESLRIPGVDSWGLLMPESHPLAQKEAVHISDLETVPLLISSQSMGSHDMPAWLRGSEGKLTIVARYNLIFNAAILVETGLGCALTLDHLADNTAHTGLTFRPIVPRQEISLHVVWKRYQVFSPAAEAFLRALNQAMEET